MEVQNKAALFSNKEGKRVCHTLGLPEDHVTLLGCNWMNHPQAAKTVELCLKLKSMCKSYGINIYGVTGASGSGKDSFVEAITHKRHIRFGDVMKDMAYEYGMVPYPRKHYEENREARHEVLPNGKTALDAWIALDVLRHYNPFIFVNIGLEKLVNEMNSESPITIYDYPIIFSGMRTELGLDVVRDLGAEYIRVVREGHEPPKNATLDELQVLYPVNGEVYNNGTLEDIERYGELLLT